MSASASSDDGPFSRSFMSMINVKVDRSNYFQWLEIIEVALKAKKLWKYVEHTNAAPAVGANGRTTLHNATYDALVRPAVNQVDIDAQEKFDSESAYVVLMLRSSLSEGVSFVATGYTNPWELFYVIEQYCKPQQNSDWQELINRKMREIKMKTVVNAPVLVSRFMNIFRNYKEAFGTELPDTTKSYLLYDALPDSGPWHEWKKIRRELAKSFADDCNAAINKELSLLNEGKGGGAASIPSPLSSDVSILSATEKDKKVQQKKCWHCDAAGHIRSECRKLKREKAEKKKAEENAATTTTHKNKCSYCGKGNHTVERCFKKQKDDASKDQMQLASGTSSFDAWCMMHVSNNSSSTDDKFYLDSGATRHLVNNRSILHDIRPLSPPLDIKVADGRSIKVGEEGVLHLDTPSGRRSLTNVALCEGAGSNLISVGGS